MDATAVRRVWSELLAAVRNSSRSTEAMLTNAMVGDVDGNVVTITHTSAPLARRLAEPRNTEAIANALSSVLGGTWQVRCTHGTPGAAATQATPTKVARPAPTRPSQAQQPPKPQVEPQQRPAPRPPADDIPPPPEPPEPDDPLPPEPEDEESMLADAARPADPNAVAAAAPQDPETVMLKLLEDELGARPLKRA
jgi:DNA polymerase-3 subunit gamma/tau